MTTEATPIIDLGTGTAWAIPRGTDEHFRRLIRFMGNLALAEFTDLLGAAEEHLTEAEDKEQLREAMDLLRRLPPATTRYILTHPVWIYWVRATRQITCSLKQGAGVAPHWRGHLRHDNSRAIEYLRDSLSYLSHLVLAGYMLAGQEIELAIKITDREYLSVPGTGLSYVLPAGFNTATMLLTAAVRERVDGKFSLMVGSGVMPPKQLSFIIQSGRVRPIYSEDSISRHWLSTVELAHGDFEIDNRDNRFLNNWVTHEVYPQGIEVTTAQDAEIPLWQQRLTEAFEIMEKCNPLIAEELIFILRSIVPVTSNHSEQSISCSNRDFWGAIQMSPHPGIALTEVLTHEYRHNILNAIMDADPVVDESSPREAIFYSPWRKDPRPLHGLIHGIYSFMEVVGFYQSYLERYGPRAPQADLAEERFVSNAYRLKIAADEFGQHAKLTPFGHEFFEGIQRRVDKFEQDAFSLDRARWNIVTKQVDEQRSEFSVG